MRKHYLLTTLMFLPKSVASESTSSEVAGCLTSTVSAPVRLTTAQPSGAVCGARGSVYSNYEKTSYQNRFGPADSSSTCSAACFEDPDCKAILYDPTGPSCFILTGDSSVAFINDPDSSFYFFDHDCFTSSAIVTSCPDTSSSATIITTPSSTSAMPSGCSVVTTDVYYVSPYPVGYVCGDTNTVLQSGSPGGASDANSPLDCARHCLNNAIVTASASVLIAVVPTTRDQQAMITQNLPL